MYITKIGAKMIHISKVQLIDESAMGLYYYLFFLFNCIRDRSSCSNLLFWPFGLFFLFGEIDFRQ